MDRYWKYIRAKKQKDTSTKGISIGGMWWKYNKRYKAKKLLEIHLKDHCESRNVDLCESFLKS